MKGCFFIARQIFDSPIWRDNPHHLKLFLYLVGTARHDKNPKRFSHFTVSRGELVTSLADIAEDNEFLERGRPKKWSRAKVSRMLEYLAENDYISLLPDTYGTHIKIVNYSTYQTIVHYKADSSETQPDASETQVSIYKNVNNDKKDKKTTKTHTDSEWDKINKLKHEYFSDEEWQELIKIRKKAKATQSERAYKNLLPEFDKAIAAGSTADDILNAMSSGKGWAGFKYEWMKNKQDKLMTFDKSQTFEETQAQLLLRRM